MKGSTFAKCLAVHMASAQEPALHNRRRKMTILDRILVAAIPVAGLIALAIAWVRWIIGGP